MKRQQGPQRIAHLTVLLTLGVSLLVNLPGGRASVATQPAHAAASSARAPRAPRAGAARLPDRTASGTASAAMRASYARLPMRFELNEGQTDPRVRFIMRGGGSTIFLTNTEAVLAVAQGTATDSKTPKRPLAGSALRAHVVGFDMGHLTQGATHEDVIHLRYAGANPHPHVVGLDRLPGVSNYFIGNDRRKWRANVPSYARVELRDVYPGIDLVYYGRNGQLEYDWVLRPSADPQRIRLAVEGTKQVHLDAQGNVILQSGGVRMRQARPIIYQEIGGRKSLVSGHYVLTGHRQIGMVVGAYNARARLVIDPVLVYSTYLGGSGEDVGHGIAVDAAGAAYVTGSTASTDFPTANALQPRSGGGADAFVAKISDASAPPPAVSPTPTSGSLSTVINLVTDDRNGTIYPSGDPLDPHIVDGNMVTVYVTVHNNGSTPLQGDVTVRNHDDGTQLARTNQPITVDAGSAGSAVLSFSSDGLAWKNKQAVGAIGLAASFDGVDSMFVDVPIDPRPVVLAHGLASAYSMWHEWYRPGGYLANMGYPAARFYDQDGFGRTAQRVIVRLSGRYHEYQEYTDHDDG